MSARRGRSVRRAAKCLGLAIVLIGIVALAVRRRAAARSPVPVRRQAISSSGPRHRQLVGTASLDDPAQPDLGLSSHTPGAVPDQAVHPAHAAMQSAHGQPAVGALLDAAAGAAQPPVAGRTDEEAQPSWPLPAAAPNTGPSVSDLPPDSVSSSGAVSPAQPSSDPAPVGSPNLESRAAPLAGEILERVTPQERLRAFEWLFGPKQPQPPPDLSPAAATAVAHDPACAAFYRRHPLGPRTVAVVGNGPLTEADAARIDGMDLVMRFNRLESW